MDTFRFGRANDFLQYLSAILRELSSKKERVKDDELTVARFSLNCTTLDDDRRRQHTVGML